MESSKDKETGSIKLYLSKEEIIKIAVALSETSNPILLELKNKIINS